MPHQEEWDIPHLQWFLRSLLPNYTHDEHYDEIFEQAGWDEDNMRIFDVGLIRGLEYVLNKLQEYGEAE